MRYEQLVVEAPTEATAIQEAIDKAKGHIPGWHVVAMSHCQRWQRSAKVSDTITIIILERLVGLGASNLP